eukprot:CAMPEP_0194031458 /NCGR_PEP_ID=MMETSP0009_2-20130614/4627_1 /TAXON_ID=210454 /ORGANISM="Grammatophora oceanica, Strain CCMP 410" /LENGTH=790 /DNA_ID=CAMNT_0038671613 /DNA_START=88 /DNA_END=2460 /DNA_ORIENTATION=+
MREEEEENGPLQPLPFGGCTSSDECDSDVSNATSKKKRRRKNSLVTRRGIYKRKYHVRAIVQTVAFCGLLVGYAIYAHVGGQRGASSTNSLPPTTPTADHVVNDLNDFTTTLATHRRRLADETGTEAPMEEEEDDDKIKCSDIDTADPKWLMAPYAIGVIYMFLALAIACDEFFVPALEEMSCERRLNLSMDVAGATLMAAGGSAPELFTSLFGTFQESAIGFGTIVGSAVFNVLFVIAMCSLLAKETLQLTWWPLFRDSFYYAIGLGVLATFVGVISPSEIEIWESCVLFVMYLGYITLMYFNARLYKLITGRDYVHPEEEEDDDDDDDGDDVPEQDNANRDISSKEDFTEEDGEGVEIGKNGDALERPRTNNSMVSTGSMRNRPSTLEQHGSTYFRWQGTFRAGILKLLRDPDSWVDTAGVGIVAKLAGDVDQVFREVDKNGDGEIDVEELEQLFNMLECHLTQEELQEVFGVLDEDGDGKICEQEFSKWYVRSEERILSQVKHIFDTFDTNNSHTIERDELRHLLEKLEPRVTEQDVEDAIDQMHKTGSREEITFEEFSEWYRRSLIYERHKKAVESDMGGVWENLKPPFGENCLTWAKYLIVLPLVAAMSLTVPDVTRPGNGKWCYLSFIMSILWIGGFSYFMVDWADIIGNTIGIPSEIMGLTILAAGTSVPDLLSSVIVARRGNGDMAVSSSVGSNIFDILVGLPIPWLLFSVWPNDKNFVEINSDGTLSNILILLTMLAFIILAIHCQGWKLTKTLGGMMFVGYAAYLVQAIWFALPFEVCVD